MPESRRPNFLEPELVKEIYKNGSKELGARPFLKGAGAKIREPGACEKSTGSITLILTRLLWIICLQNQLPIRIFTA